MTNDSYSRKNGHPPSAAKVVCIDFDGTIVPWGGLLDPKKKPFPGAAEAIQALRDSGWRIVILTSRMSPSWWRAEAITRGVNQWEFGRQQKAYVAGLLTKHGIPFDKITAEKVPAQAYFDDKAVFVQDGPGGGAPLASAIGLFLELHP